MIFQDSQGNPTKKRRKHMRDELQNCLRNLCDDYSNGRKTLNSFCQAAVKMCAGREKSMKYPVLWLIP